MNRYLSVLVALPVLTIAAGPPAMVRTVTPEPFAAGKAQFLKADFKAAVRTFRALSEAEPSNSDYALWLGKAYERQAEVSNPVRSGRYAALARRSLEHAVELDPNNREALRELLDSYLDSNRFRSTDWQKATAVAERISGVDREDGKIAQALLKIRGREMHSAEEIFIQTVQFPSDLIGSLIR